MEAHVIIGYLGTILYGLVQIPQIYKAYQRKSTQDLSLYFLCLYQIASILTLYYSLKLYIYPIILSNLLSILSNSVLIYFYFYYQNVQQ